MRKIWVKVALLLIICLNLLPLTVLAAGDTPPPKEPYEKVAAKKGSWYTDQLSYEGRSNLVVGYKGSYEKEAAKPELAFTLAENILLTGVYIPYAGMDAGEITLILKDSRGNQYQNFAVSAELAGGISETDEDIMVRQTANSLYTFTPQDNLTLAKGGYTLYLGGNTLPADAFLLKGYNSAAYQKYLEKLQEWAGEEGQEESAEDQAVKETAVKEKETAETAIAGKDTIIIDKEPFAIMENKEIPVPMNFTGTYKINLNLYKTQTLMGPVNSKESSFSLRDYELTVLDKGSKIELIGQYEGMPFSQNCEVTGRKENLVTAKLNFAADLTKLPYNARIAANAEVTLKKEPGRVSIAMAGQGFYSRAATADKGADENTYSLDLQGGRVKTDLPPFVMAAISKAYGAGNIPGPDSPAQAAAGMLFPPLVGLVVSVLQGLLKPKGQISAAGDGLPTKLSVGEQSMKDANRSLGKGLYTEEEARAWSMLGDALGASGGDAEDAVSIGDNERPGGAEYAATQESSFGGADDYDSQDYESEEDLSFGKPDVPPEAQAGPPEQPEQPLAAAGPVTAPVEPESLVVQTSVRGATTLIIRDPATGQWVNSETGNPFDLEAHQKNFPEQFKEFNDYIKRNEELEASGQTAMQQALDEIEKKRQTEIGAIQKEMDRCRWEQLQQDQERLEWEREHAQSLNSWGRIIGDSINNAGDELAEAGKYVKDNLSIAGEALSMTAKDLFNPEQAMKNIGESYESVKGTLGSVKDKVAGVAEKVYNDPWIIAKGAVGIAKGVIKTVTDPKKAWEVIKDSVGLEDFAKSIDPNIPLIDRIGHTLAGTAKLGLSLGTGGLGTAAKGTAATAGKGAGKLGGLLDDVLGLGSKKMTAKAPVQGIKNTLPVKTGPSYAGAGRPADLSGVTKTSQKIIQNTADEFGVQIKARPTTAPAQTWIDSGKAVPKGMDMKAKTLNIYDEMLGGPKNCEGLVGYYKPKLPPKEIIKNLSQETQEKLVEQYKTRRREFWQLSDKMKQYEVDGKYKVVDGLVVNKNGKFVTGDVDVYDIVNFDGTPVSESVKKQVIASMTSKKGSNVMHEGLMSWNEGGIDFSQAAKDKMIAAATKNAPGKGVTSYNPLAAPTSEVYIK